MQYIFTAVITKDADGSLFVSFPDIPGCTAKGNDAISAVKEAETVLGLCLFDMEQRNLPIPKGRLPDELRIREGQFTSVVAVDTETYREYANKTIDCAITIPAWMGRMVEKSNIDFAHMLERSLKREAGFPLIGDEEEFGAPRARKPLRVLSAAPPAGRPGVAAGAGRQVVRPHGKQAEAKAPPMTGGMDQKFTYLILGLTTLTIIMAVFWFMATRTDWLDHLWIPDETQMATGTGQTFTPAQIEELRRQREYEDAQRENEVDDDHVDPVFLPAVQEPAAPPANSPSAAGDAVTEIQNARQQHNNPDVVAFLSIDFTGINYPIVQGHDNAFYHNHDIGGSASNFGWMFMDADVSDPFDRTRNTVIFGGNPADGTMFSDLASFNDFNFFNSVPTITLTTEYEVTEWEVFSFYHDPTNFQFARGQFEPIQAWRPWLDNFAYRCMHDSSLVEVGANDYILTLVTYANGTSGPRYVLHARLVS